ncbi:MAG: hypothetical protein IPJ82_06075 [Lewinellaceae bacterium]|nr:hypothetical protein [Lewinellaceae bacterium]
MRPTLDNSKYPVFEANQVLTNRHLNQVFNYIDEQERLTRANLIGVGIVCGLEIEPGGTAAAPTVRIGKGCGITSEGYLIVEQEAVELVSYLDYVPPVDLPYSPFKGVTKLWEMFPANVEPAATPFPANFLNNKVVLLFLELKKDGLRNCSPTNCDDRGAEVLVTLRRLLIDKDDARISFLINGATGITPQPNISDLEHKMLDDLHLVDIRLPRYNVPASALTSSNTVLASYVSVFRNNSLATRVGAALKKAYDAFEPLLKDIYPTNPFTGFAAKYSFLDVAPQNTTQARFLQYYYDLFDDLIKAYDEFRWTGAELMCACCPFGGLFPRHLLLGLLHPELWTANDPRIFRHHFMASSAISDCEERTATLQQLFRRLVEMTQRFSNDPPLLMLKGPANLQSHIRITPSKLGDVPLSEKCIPYYYLQDGTPQLFQLWNAEKNRRKRAHLNLSYRSYEYDANLPDFVADPLRFDLEPHNFLRVEGHLGKDYIQVLSALQEQKMRYRLPVEIIALRTGAFDETMEVDINMENCRFQDLETLYDVTREQWMGFLCNDLTYLYGLKPFVQAPASGSEVFDEKGKAAAAKVSADTPVSAAAAATPDLPTPRPYVFKSKYPFINTYAPDYYVSSDTLGGRFEKDFNTGTILRTNVTVKNEADQLNNLVFNIYQAILNLVATLPQTLKEFKLTDFSSRCAILTDLVQELETGRENSMKAGSVKNFDEFSPWKANFMLWEETDDRLEDLIYNCRADAYKSIMDEYVRRVKEVKQKQFLSHFLLHHPGIQHKAGVPVGGTFILVYHDAPDNNFPKEDLDVYQEAQLKDEILPKVSDEALEADKDYAARTGKTPVFTPEFEEAFKRLQLNEDFAYNEDFRAIQRYVTGKVFDPKSNYDILLNKDANKVIAQYLNGIPDRTVIADFFLPYLCCSDCAGVQYVLPPTLPTFTYTAFCTGADNRAEVAIVPQGGTPSYSYKVDSQDYTPLSGRFFLQAGTHTVSIRDAAGTESAPQTIIIQPKMIATTPSYTCKDDLTSYTVEFSVSGGTPPYTANRGNVDADNKYISNPIPNGTGDNITVLDSNGCSVVVPITKTCTAPLEFTATPKCTSSEDQKALIVFQVKGGLTPYQLKVDGGAFGAITEHLKLSVGAHTLILRDQAGTEKTVTVTVPDPLLAAIPADGGYTCNRAGTEYMAKIFISGGKAPYKVNGITATASPFVYGPVSTGKSETLKITDSLGCQVLLPITYRCPRIPIFDVNLSKTDSKNQARLTLNPGDGEGPFFYQLDGGEFLPVKGEIILGPGRHTLILKDKDGNLSEARTIEVQRAEVKPPIFETDCNKPCAGISKKGGYRLWVQPSSSPFEVYKPGEVEFTFTDEKGKTQNIPGISVGVLTDLLNRDFNGTIGALIVQINDRISRAIGEGRVVLSYEPGDKDPFARLWIETFQCEMFSMKFTFDYAQGGPVKEYEVRYMKTGEVNGALFSNLQIDSAPVQVPVSDISIRDQCKDTAFEKLCKETIPRVGIKPLRSEGDILTLSILGAPSLLTSGITWLWEIERSAEAIYIGPEVKVKVPGLAQGTKVKLTGITKQGCVTSVTQTVGALK